MSHLIISSINFNKWKYVGITIALSDGCCEFISLMYGEYKSNVAGWADFGGVMHGVELHESSLISIFF